MMTPKNLLEASALARRLLFLRAQQANLEKDFLLSELFAVAGTLEVGEQARGIVCDFLYGEVARQIEETMTALLHAGVDPDAEWPHAEGFR